MKSQDQKGNTPLHAAVCGAQAEIINLLIDNKADTNITNEKGLLFTEQVMFTVNYEKKIMKSINIEIHHDIKLRIN